MSAGKGSTPRKVDCGKYATNYERIFSKPVVHLCHKCGKEKEWHYIYGMTCEECDFNHDQLVTKCNHLNSTTNDN
jgi:hypothetical protein